MQVRDLVPCVSFPSDLGARTPGPGPCWWLSGLLQPCFRWPCSFSGRFYRHFLPCDTNSRGGPGRGGAFRFDTTYVGTTTCGTRTAAGTAKLDGSPPLPGRPAPYYRPDVTGYRLRNCHHTFCLVHLPTAVGGRELPVYLPTTTTCRIYRT